MAGEGLVVVGDVPVAVREGLAVDLGRVAAALDVHQQWRVVPRIVDRLRKERKRTNVENYTNDAKLRCQAPDIDRSKSSFCHQYMAIKAMKSPLDR